VIRLIALDLDGTLLGPDLRLSPVDGEAVVAARERGVQIALATSRWYRLAQRTARRLELRAPLICHNGAHIKEPEDGPELLHLRIATEAAREIAAFCDEGGFETYTTVDGITYMRTPREAQIDPQRLPKDMRLARTHAEHIVADATGFVVFGQEAVQGLVDAFAERYAGVLTFPVGVSETSQAYVTITAAGADKGRALRLVCQHLGVPSEEAMAVGDAAPDIAMFDVAGTGVAMGNAPEEVKSKADAVAPSNAEAGVAWAIRRYVLEES
jgi:Cof subfamily protein (haloacid dehalogenase superfamily)